MKRQPNLRICVGSLLLALISQNGMASTQKLVLNNSSEINLKNSIQYDYSSSPRKVILDIDDPIVCQNVYDSSGNFVLNVFDSNDTSPVGLAPVVLESFYEPNLNRFTIKADASLQCATENGMIFTRTAPSNFTGDTDLIYRNGLEPNTVDIRLTITPGDVTTISDNQELNYQINVSNRGGAEAVIDVVDFFDKASSGVPYLTSGGWNCVHSSGDNSRCGSVGGSDTVFLDDAVLADGESLIIFVNRQANAPFPQTGGEFINLLAGAFVSFTDTSGYIISDRFFSNNSDFKSLEVTNNIPPEVTKILDQNMNEDGVISGIEFSVSDPDSTAPLTNISAFSSNDEIVPNSSIVINGTGAQRTLTITPDPDQNTADDPVEITVQVIDNAGGVGQETFSLFIDPVNDAPSFSFVEDVIVHPIGTQGLIGPRKGFLQDLELGPTSDENELQTIEEIIVDTQGDSIFAAISGGEPTISSTGTLTYILSGQSGTANILVSIQDDGGLANGGDDTSDTMSFSIIVETASPDVSLQKRVYEGHDSGGSCDKASEFISADTAANITFCFAVTNSGDSYLDDIDVTDTTLGLDHSDLDVVGTPSLPVAPGVTVTWYLETTVDGDLQNVANVIANPVTATGDDLIDQSDVDDTDDALVNEI